MSALIFALAVVGALDAVTSTPLNAGPSLPDCAGHYEVLRNDTVFPGKFEVFLQAVRDQQAWYAAHGFGDKVLVGRAPSADHPGEFSPTTAMTIHTDMTSSAAPPRDDAAWKAVLAEYDASSVQLSTTLVCVTAP